jgi:hypothetical protein
MLYSGQKKECQGPRKNGLRHNFFNIVRARAVLTQSPATVNIYTNILSSIRENQ